MRAVVLDAPTSPLRLAEDHAEPTADHATGAEVIEVTACGVCHSDLHVVDGDFPSPLPMILGHEVTGVHPELGPVMVYAPWGCGDCEQCAEGNDMICADATEAGLFTDGGYAERMRVPDRSYLSPLGGLDPVASAPLACGGLTAYRAVLHGLDVLRRPGPRRRRALVIGAGGLGQYAIRYLRLLTEAEVHAVDLSEAKRTTAVEIGATAAHADAAEVPPVDVVIDFIGNHATLASAAGAVAKQGAVIVVGLYGGRIEFGLGAVAHEARFLSSFWGSRPQLDELLDLARREPTIVAPVETLPLAEAQAAHDRLRSGDVKGRLVLTTD
ncbi:MAG: alcohol dehydrogenase catalytic domain-containing protein [Actinomycetota bacterium]